MVALDWSSQGYSWWDRVDVTPDISSAYSGIREECRHRQSPEEDRSHSSAICAGCELAYTVSKLIMEMPET